MPGVSQKMLSQTLRSLQRDGLVARRVEPTVPPRVHYQFTSLGRTLEAPLAVLRDWVEQAHMSEVDRSGRRGDTAPEELDADLGHHGGAQGRVLSVTFDLPGGPRTAGPVGQPLVHGMCVDVLGQQQRAQEQGGNGKEDCEGGDRCKQPRECGDREGGCAGESAARHLAAVRRVSGIC